MDVWEMYDNLIDALGAEVLVDELARALTTDQLRECCEFIARNHDLDELDEDDYSDYDPDTADADRYPSTEDGKVFDRLY